MTATLTRANAVAERSRWRPGTWKSLGPGDFPTLGWGVLEHASEHLPNPSDDALPWVFTDEQARKILEWYRLDPDTGEPVYRRRRDEEAKGRGKSPEAAVGAIEEFVGPVRFDGWDSNGQPVGVAWGTGGRVRPWVWLAAVSEDQTGNTYNALYQLLTARQGRVAEELRIDVGQTRLHLMDMPGAILEPVTARAGSKEGTPTTYVVLDETQLWTPQSGGVKLAATIRRNLAKMDGRSHETCNAPLLGQRSVAESSDTAEPGILHFAERPATEPQPEWSDDQLLEVISWVYRNSPWVKPQRILKEVRDPDTNWDDALRFYFNVRTVGASRVVDPRDWDALKVTLEVPTGSAIGLGLDGSDSHDATVLRGCTAGGHTFILGRWSRPPGVEDWHVPRAEVMRTIEDAFTTYRVGKMLADPPRWQAEIELLQERHGEIVEALDTNSARRMAPAVDRWRVAIANAARMVREHDGAGPLLLPYSHDGDEFTTDQVKATRLRKVRLSDVEDDRTLYMLEKDGRVGNDATVADVLAFEAAMTMDEPEVEPEPFVIFGKRR